MTPIPPFLVGLRTRLSIVAAQLRSTLARGKLAQADLTKVTVSTSTGIAPLLGRLRSLRIERRDWPLIGLAGLLLASVVGVAVMLLVGEPQTSRSRIASVDIGDTQLASGAVPPPVVPNQLMAISADDARAQNAQQPFSSSPNPPARPFVMSGDDGARVRAVDCLAAAVLYEAGDDSDGQRAVAQVVLNRVRHPAYPKSVCGVVFQGSERHTGCQFTFTCDGALSRRYSDLVWSRARGIAIDALNGSVYYTVGLATHYHTDWVRPYWSPSMDKVARVGTHLFFRWPGVWGSQRAMVGRVSGDEPVIARLAAISPAHNGGTVSDPALATATVTDAQVAAAISTVVPRASVQLGDTIILTLERNQPAATFPALAEAACGARGYCKVMGWTNPALAPATAAMSDMQRAAMSFSYLRDQPHNLERALWNCEEFGREQTDQCMRR